MNYETYADETDAIISLLTIVECLEHTTYPCHTEKSIYHNTAARLTEQ